MNIVDEPVPCVDLNVSSPLAYTEDEGASWIKLPFGLGGNPVIYNWPMEKLSQSPHRWLDSVEC